MGNTIVAAIGLLNLIGMAAFFVYIRTQFTPGLAARVLDLEGRMELVEAGRALDRIVLSEAISRTADLATEFRRAREAENTVPGVLLALRDLLQRVDHALQDVILSETVRVEHLRRIEAVERAAGIKPR